MRIQEAYFLESKMYYQFDAIKYLGNTSFYDLKVLLSFSSLLIPLVFVLKNVKKISIIYFTLLIVLNGVFIKYFLSNFMLLGTEMFAFSSSELFYIIKNEIINYQLYEYVLLIVYPIVFIIIAIFLIKKEWKVSKYIKRLLLTIYIIFIVATAFEYKYFIPKYTSFKSYHEFLINNNKLVFYITDIIKKNKRETFLKLTRNLKTDIISYQKTNSKFSYTSKQYPLMHNTPYENVLGKYFIKDTIKPNIVFIMVEGLGSAFSGINAHLGSLTPFIDSLLEKSLYWEHFLSNAERTYGVLPNSISSAPYMNQFIQQNEYINHTSIIEELSSNGYQTNFNYGGWANFSNMENFLKFNRINDINSELNFDTTYFKKHLSSEDDFHWGYDDGAMLKQFLLHSKQFKEPYLSLILTISMHSPWDVDHNYTLEDAIEYLGETSDYQKELLKAQTDVVKSIIFFDNKLKDFFSAYSKRPDYKNTIFLIYGDHNMHILPEKNEIDAFHVPLIIHSNLITKHKKFKGVSTHRDLTPTILGLLEGNYNMKFSEDKHWLGLSLDTSLQYNNEQITPLVMGSNSFLNFMYKNNVVIHEQVFELDEYFELKPEKDSIKIKETLKTYYQYQNIEKYMFKQDKLFSK